MQTHHLLACHICFDFWSITLQGGFSAWASAGLPIKTIAEYGTSALDALTDEAEILATRTRSAVGYLRCEVTLLVPELTSILLMMSILHSACQIACVKCSHCSLRCSFMLPVPLNEAIDCLTANVLCMQ